MGADLGQLLEAERAFAVQIDAARREARALVEVARTEAEALRNDSADALLRSKQALAEEEDRALGSELTRLAEETAARVDRLSAVDEARVAALADQLLRVLLAGVGP